MYALLGQTLFTLVLCGRELELASREFCSWDRCRSAYEMISHLDIKCVWQLTYEHIFVLEVCTV